MRFAIVGDHPDGLRMATALVETGRHQLVSFSARDLDERWRRVWPDEARHVADLEAILADPTVEMVVVASKPSLRAEHLRRSLQSERHVLCVHPLSGRPDPSYEMAILQQDTRNLLLPLLPRSLHPAITRFKEFLKRRPDSPERPESGEGFNGSVGADREAIATLRGSPIALPPPVEQGVLALEHWGRGEVLWLTETPDQKPCFPDWDVLRAIGGEVLEVSALAPGEEVQAGEAVLLAGRFERGLLFQAAIVPGQPEDRWRLRVLGGTRELELLFPLGLEGPSFLSWRDRDGVLHEEGWEPWDPWPAMVQVVEEALGAAPSVEPAEPRVQLAVGSGGSEAITAETKRPARPSSSEITADVPLSLPRQRPIPASPWLSWQDAVRCHELDDAARRSVEKRRTSVLEYQEASEEVTFKGTMTLVGCGVLWTIIVLLILSRWVPWLGWLGAGLLAVFLVLQLLRLVIPAREKPRRPA